MLSVQITFGVRLLEDGPTRRASVLINLVILLTYPTNFFIYCAMSTQFRDTFARMFATCRRPHGATAAAAGVESRDDGSGQAMLMIRLNTTVAGSSRL